MLTISDRTVPIVQPITVNERKELSVAFAYGKAQGGSKHLIAIYISPSVRVPCPVHDSHRSYSMIGSKNIMAKHLGARYSADNCHHTFTDGESDVLTRLNAMHCFMQMQRDLTDSRTQLTLIRYSYRLRARTEVRWVLRQSERADNTTGWGDGTQAIGKTAKRLKARGKSR